MNPCKFFASGSCRSGVSCRFSHDGITGTQSPPGPVKVHPSPYLGQNNEKLNKTPFDSRSKVPCKFFSLPSGCRNDPCPFLHTKIVPQLDETDNTQPSKSSEEQDDERDDDDYNRSLAGASVDFDEFGHVVKVSFPTDYSIARVTGFPPETKLEAIVGMFRDLGFDLNVNCIRVPRRDASSTTTATIKVEDPSFAHKLSTRLKDQKSNLTAIPVAIDARQRSCKKVHISWHKATRSVWLNFGNSEIANRVAKKFNAGTYVCMGQNVRSTAAKESVGRRYRSHNPLAWTVTLSGVPHDATYKDVEDAIRLPFDKPRHVEMGQISYDASDAEVSVEVRTRLEEHGRLLDFRLASASKGKRSKATAWFQDEEDARSAYSLNNTPLDILGRGKLTVALIHTAKFKVSKIVYAASKSEIDGECDNLRRKHLTVNSYPDPLHPFTTLRVEGENAKDVADAQRALDPILGGTILMHNAIPVWGPTLGSNGSAYTKLKSIEKELNVVLARDKSNHQIRFYGSPEKKQQALAQITNMLEQESSTVFEIDLSPPQFLWAIRGGFKSIEQALGKDCANFNVVSKTITINGTRQQYATALDMTNNQNNGIVEQISDPSSAEDCPICFCPAEDPVQTSCKHTYCLECLENYCNSAASTSKDKFQITCQGNEGTCPTPFTLHELKSHLSSPAFEHILTSSFKEHIARHPTAFQYCPTPDCGFIYRSTTATSPSTFSCPRCFESTCTACHARHGEYTCAEFKDISSGGREALARLKRELNIKDCPRCTTPMEKTEGCNHMTCGGCKAHICWVCMEVFGKSSECYEHMNEVHGGIGLDHLVGLVF